MDAISESILKAVNWIFKIVATSYIGGVLYLILGIKMIKNQLKENVNNVDWSSPFQGYIKGWVFGIGATIAGLLIIILKIFGKL